MERVPLSVYARKSLMWDFFAFFLLALLFQYFFRWVSRTKVPFFLTRVTRETGVETNGGKLSTLKWPCHFDGEIDSVLLFQSSVPGTFSLGASLQSRFYRGGLNQKQFHLWDLMMLLKTRNGHKFVREYRAPCEEANCLRRAH